MESSYNLMGSAWGDSNARPTSNNKVRDRIRVILHMLDNELAKVDAFGDDDFASGTVLTFSTNFGNVYGPTYDYAAIKAGNNRWHLTGENSPQGVTWDELCTWWSAHNVEAVDIRRMKKAVSIVAD